MPTEDETVIEQAEQPEAAAPDPKPAAEAKPSEAAPKLAAPEPEPIDLAAALAKQRLELEAENAAKLEQARTEAAEQALATERARLAEEHRVAALTETERLAEQHRATEAENKRLADELAASKASAAATEQKLSIVAAMADAQVRLARNDNGDLDPALERLALGEVQAKLGDGLTIPAALAELQAAKPWMFHRHAEADPNAGKPTNTAGSRGAAPGRTLGPRVEPPPNVLTQPEDEWRKTKRTLKMV